MERSLERFGLDFIDLVFCHRPDPETPIEETVFTMSEMVSSWKAHYWGTSEWSAQELLEAYEIAEKISPSQTDDGTTPVSSFSS